MTSYDILLWYFFIFSFSVSYRILESLFETLLSNYHQPFFIFFFFFFFCFVVVVFFRAAPGANEVPRLGVKLELQFPAYPIATAIAVWDLSHVCDLHHCLWQHQILNLLSKGRDRTCIVMDASRVHNLLSHNGNSSITLSFHFFFSNFLFFFLSFLVFTLPIFSPCYNGDDLSLHDALIPNILLYLSFIYLSQ